MADTEELGPARAVVAFQPVEGGAACRPQTPPPCKAIRLDDPGYGCELPAGHSGAHEALGGDVAWTVSRADGCGQEDSMADTEELGPYGGAAGVSAMQGALLVRVERATSHEGNEALDFYLADGRVYRMTHLQSCCESVSLVDGLDDLLGLQGALLTVVEEVDSGDADPEDGDESYTWTFYKFQTPAGDATLRWYGSSNGYYSESVDFYLVGRDGTVQDDS